MKIIFRTALKVIERDGITEEGMATALDLGDYLLESGRVEKDTYDKKQIEAKELMNV